MHVIAVIASESVAANLSMFFYPYNNEACIIVIAEFPTIGLDIVTADILHD
jgi:hypothetical protein